MTETDFPLSRFKVLDLTVARAGPTAVRILADWGADVIRIEPPPTSGGSPSRATGGRHEPDFQNLHRNKRAITLNLKSTEGKDIFFEICKGADVVVENFRSQVKYRLGIDYDAVKKVNPCIVYGSISGFGQSGPYSKRPGVDQIIQGMSGLMSITGEPGRDPMRVGIAISDLSAGMLLANGILIALLDREVTGKGRWVHTSLLESLISVMDFQAARWTVAGEVPSQAGNDHPTFCPMGVFDAADGKVNIAAHSEKMFYNLCKTLNAEHLLENPNYADSKIRVLHRKELNREINEITGRMSQTELVEKLNAAGCPCGPINTIDKTFSDPQVQYLKIAKPIHHPHLGPIDVIRMPINMPDVPHGLEIRRHAPGKGEHSDEVLAEYGYDEEEIIEFRKAGVI
jgi:crotonobetainyl-CoA:carnitine CoA-transferase CaiB-like acyl-CoA transferase